MRDQLISQDLVYLFERPALRLRLQEDIAQRGDDVEFEEVGDGVS